MNTGALPLEELRRRLGEVSWQGPGAAVPEAVYRDLIGCVPPCVDMRDAATLASNLRGLPGATRGDEFLTALAEREREDRVAGAVAAYG